MHEVERPRLLTRSEASRMILVSVAGAFMGSVVWPDEAVAGTIGRKICRIGRRFIGVPYVPGGTNLHKGVDCDAYVKKVMKRAGIWVPWGPANQAYGGKKRKGHPEKGDVLGFDEHGSGISHTAIYSGNGYCLHASSYFDQVVESKVHYIKRKYMTVCYYR